MEPDMPSQTPPPPAHSHRLLITLLIIGTLTLAGIMVWRAERLHSIDAANKLASNQNSGYDDRMASPDKTFKLTVNDEKLLSGPSHINVRYNDSVHISLKAVGSDEIEAHLDGYDVSTESAPSDDTPGGFTFIADKKGSFNFYLFDESAGASATTGRHDLGVVTVR
jgi:hypothetical protein